MAEQEQNTSPRKSVFISYAHRDDREDFVSRLGYALDMYMDAFWDVKLQAGSWDKQLVKNIEECDAFLVVMSHIQKNESEWCKKELDLARSCGKTIIPIRRFDNFQDEEFERLQFVDFTQSFDEGFKELMYMVRGERFSSWEYLYTQADNHLLESLKNGLVPALIAKEFGDWLVVDRLWPIFRSELDNQMVMIRDPRTPSDVRLTIYNIYEQDARTRVRNRIDMTILEGYLERNKLISDTDHKSACSSTMSLFENIVGFFESLYRMKREPKYLKPLKENFPFDAVSKLRELIIIHSRRSRHLY
jgi:hypothetical protein